MNWKFHHVGMATESVVRARARLNILGSETSSEFTDPLQGVKGVFVELGDTLIELLEPLPGDETLLPWLQEGNRVYQIAFETNDLDRQLDEMRSRGVLVVREPLPAVAFDGRRVAFLMPLPGLLVELIEATQA